MYKGKFDQKSRENKIDVQELLAQREAAPASPPPARRPAAHQGQAKRPDNRQVPRPAQNRAAGTQNRTPAPQSQRPAPQKSAKRGSRLGGTIFYTLYFLFILVFFLGTYLGLNWLNGWLRDYEASQPTVKAQQVFDQLFTNPQWGDIYASAGAQDTLYENKDAFAAYMEQKVGGQSLNYLETSAGLSGGKKYVIRLGDEKLATFTLTDRNKDTQAADPLGKLAKIPDWQLSAVEVIIDRTETYRIVRLNGHKTLVNGVELEDDHTIQKAGTLASEYLPEGVADVSMCTQEISGLFATPTVTVFDDKGNQMEVTYDEASRTFTERTTSNTITEEQTEAVRKAAEMNNMWMIKEVKDRAKLAQCFDPAGSAYKDILSMDMNAVVVQDYGSREFVDFQVSDFVQYNDSLFSVRVSMTMRMTSPSGATTRDFPYLKSMFFQKSDGGKWLCSISTNVDVSQPQGKVRLTFMQGDNQLYSDFFTTDATSIQAPKISNIPEGKVFTGWVREVEENGQTVLQLMFQPDENGLVTLPAGNVLEPMTLYTLFEDAGAASSVIQETEPAAQTDASQEPQA